MSKIFAGVVCLALAVCMFHLINVDRPMSKVSEYYLNSAVEDTNCKNIVGAVLFDYRAFDTMIEIIVLFSVSLGTGVLFTHNRFKLSSEGMGIIIKTALSYHLPFIFIFCFYLLFFGHTSAGGGFQGGVILATISIMIAVVYGIGHYRGVISQRLEGFLEVFGGIVFILLGFLSIYYGGNYLSNKSARIPMGDFGAIFSGGLILWLDIAAGLLVSGSMSIIFYSMVKKGHKSETE